MSESMYSACDKHQGIRSMPFTRALDVARDCDQCYVELAE